MQGHLRDRSPFTDILQPGPERTAGHNRWRTCHFLIVCYDRDGEYESGGELSGTWVFRRVYGHRQDKLDVPYDLKSTD
jgi:hypothetical protein